MDFGFSEEQEKFRKEIHNWLADGSMYKTENKGFKQTMYDKLKGIDKMVKKKEITSEEGMVRKKIVKKVLEKYFK